MKTLLLLAWAMLILLRTFAAPAPANFDESKIGNLPLPDPLVLEDGTPVRNAAMWRERRRPELLELFAREVYGRTPAGRPPPG